MQRRKREEENRHAIPGSVHWSRPCCGPIFSFSFRTRAGPALQRRDRNARADRKEEKERKRSVPLVPRFLSPLKPCLKGYHWRTIRLRDGWIPRPGPPITFQGCSLPRQPKNNMNEKIISCRREHQWQDFTFLKFSFSLPSRFLSLFINYIMAGKKKKEKDKEKWSKLPR